MTILFWHWFGSLESVTSPHLEWESRQSNSPIVPYALISHVMVHPCLEKPFEFTWQASSLPRCVARAWILLYSALAFLVLFFTYAPLQTIFFHVYTTPCSNPITRPSPIRNPSTMH